METIDELPLLLERLERHWRRLRSPLSQIALPGLSDDQIDELIAPTGLALPTELRVWWRWRNGTTLQHTRAPDAWLCACTWPLLGLTECVEYYVDLYDAEYGEDLSYARTWLPLSLRTYGHEYLIVDTSTDDSSSGVIQYDQEAQPEEELAVADSLTALVGMWVERLDAGEPTVTWQGDQYTKRDVQGPAHPAVTYARFG